MLKCNRSNQYTENPHSAGASACATAVAQPSLSASHTLSRRAFVLTALALAGCAEMKEILLTEPPAAAVIMSPNFMVKAMIDLAAVKPGDLVYDLGCGDGSIVIEAARRGARGFGIDRDAGQIKLAVAAAAAAKVSDRVQFTVGDLFEVDVREATVVTLYLGDEPNLKLRPKLRSQLKRGSRIVSRQFRMGDWNPDRTVEVGGRYLYLWNL